MAVQSDFAVYAFEDGLLNINMTPPTVIGGWNITYTMTKRQGGDALDFKCVASGFNGSSGITILNSGQGAMRVTLIPSTVSGLDPGAYYFRMERTGTGVATLIADGYRQMK